MKTIILCLALFGVTIPCFSSDRDYWVELATRMAEPVLSNMANGTLKKNMTIEVSPTWDNRNIDVMYLECFGRLMAGIAPWLALPDDDTPEGQTRKRLREYALKAYANAVDPESPDYLGWSSGQQTLVDAAYLVQSFYRAYDALWVPLDETTKKRYHKELMGLRRYVPNYSNWLLFTAMCESFLLYSGGDADMTRLHYTLSKTEEWYVGDGWYSDGPAFSFDYYNSFVIHPMYVDSLAMLAARRGNEKWVAGVYLPESGRHEGAVYRHSVAVKRMQRYGVILERLISPEGTLPVFGRSIPYRLAALQPLAQLAWEKRLPAELPPGQVRAALTAVTRRFFDTPGAENFTPDGFLRIGFVGSQPSVADYYTNNGSLYMTSLSLLPLGLPASDPFWTDPPQKWTSKRAWEGEPFPKDHRSRLYKTPLYWN